MSDRPPHHEVVDAVVGLARAHGIVDVRPVVLSATSNVVIHLAPAPVVARVPLITAAGRDRPEVSLARELAICAHLDGLGLPTTRPSLELAPGPHPIGGRWVSFVEHVDMVPVDDADAIRAGDGLADLLDALASLPDPDGLFDRSLADEVRPLLDRLAGRIAEDDHALLVAWADEAFAVSRASVQAVHADPHRRNVGRRPDGELVWFDFDDAVRDSPLVDLATLHRNWPDAGDVACARFGVDPAGPELAAFVEQREAWGGIWAQLYALEGDQEFAVGAAAALEGRRR